VRRGHRDPVDGVRFEGAEVAAPAPGVLAALADADVIAIAPSNPYVSIAPILAVDGIRDALANDARRSVAVSPLIGGRAVKGPRPRCSSGSPAGRRPRTSRPATRASSTRSSSTGGRAGRPGASARS
jgi:2-phospho-L-lactate transferase/gluconeogenesis factor (CofD/UPF0052 family)